jgi:hypothetical protein
VKEILEEVQPIKSKLRAINPKKFQILFQDHHKSRRTKKDEMDENEI